MFAEGYKLGTLAKNRLIVKRNPVSVDSNASVRYKTKQSNFTIICWKNNQNPDKHCLKLVFTFFS